MPRPSRLLLAAGLLTLLVPLAGCGSAATLAGHEYLSVSVTEGGAPRPLVAGTRIRLNFSPDGIGASAGCNQMGGAYRVDGGRLVIDLMSMTEMACDPDRDAQDQFLSTFLGSRPTVLQVGTNLTLTSGTTVIQLVDRTVAEPDLPLVGTPWTLSGIQQGDAVSSVPAGVTATIRFNDDGTFSVHAGCNQGGGTWTAVGGGIAVSGLGLTKRACDAPASTVEAAVVGVLNAGSLAVSIRASSLTLGAGAVGLMFVGPGGSS